MANENEIVEEVVEGVVEDTPEVVEEVVKSNSGLKKFGIVGIGIAAIAAAGFGIKKWYDKKHRVFKTVETKGEPEKETEKAEPAKEEKKSEKTK